MPPPLLRAWLQRASVACHHVHTWGCITLPPTDTRTRSAQAGETPAESAKVRGYQAVVAFLEAPQARAHRAAWGGEGAAVCVCVVGWVEEGACAVRETPRPTRRLPSRGATMIMPNHARYMMHSSTRLTLTETARLKTSSC